MLLARAQCTDRLRKIFPAEVIEDSIVAGDMAGAAAFVCRFAEAADGANPLRPSMVLWMCDAMAARALQGTPDQLQGERRRWYRAALGGHNQLRALMSEWGIDHRPWYAENSREPLRDEVFRRWRQLGAMLRDASVSTTSPRPAWTLAGDFASLFDPTLIGADLAAAIESWRDDHLGAVGRARLELARQRGMAAHGVDARLPSGVVRKLSAGDSSLILKGVIEEMAPVLMGQPAVLTISESARKVDVVDETVLDALGLSIQADRLLPDALLFDGAGGTFWFVEAVASDGEINEARKRELLEWAARQGVARDACAFVTAFLSRTHQAFRRRASTLAWGTYAWFLDEPQHVAALGELAKARESGPLG